MSCIAIVRTIPTCSFCQNQGFIDSAVRGRWADYCLKCWVTALQETLETEQRPWLGTGIGQLRVTEAMLGAEKLRPELVQGNKLKELCERLGDHRRYVLRIANNRFDGALSRDYGDITGDVGLVSGVIDIAWKVFTFETIHHEAYSKVWLRPLKGQW